MKRSVLVGLFAVAGLLAIAGANVLIPRGGQVTADVPSDSPAPSPTDVPSDSPSPEPTPTDPCGQVSQGYSHECPPGEPTAKPVPIGAPSDPDPVAITPAAPGAPPVAPKPVPPTLRVDSMGWCSECPAASLMIVKVYDVTAGGASVIGACGVVNIRWPDGSLENHSGCTSAGTATTGLKPGLVIGLKGPWTTAVGLLARFDFTYQGGHVVSCTNPCP